MLYANDEKRYFKDHYYSYYLGKYMIASLFKPAAIAEIGVRWGYSAFAFLCASPGASYTGFDIPEGGSGGVKQNTFPRVRQILISNFAKATVKLVRADTRRMTSLSEDDEYRTFFDFVHIDGDHHEEAAYHDMQIGFERLIPGGTMLIDDNVSIAGVTRACLRFLKDRHKEVERAIRLPSLTGELIIIKNGDSNA